MPTGTCCHTGVANALFSGFACGLAGTFLDGRLPGSDGLHAAPAGNAVVEAGHQPIRVLAGLIVAFLDQQPVFPLFTAAVLAIAHPHQSPASLHALSGDSEVQLAFRQSGCRVVQRFPGALVPEHDGATAILALLDCSFKFRVGERMVLRAHGQSLLGRIGAGAAGHRPAPQYAVPLQSKIVMQAACGVLLHEKLQVVLASAGWLSLRFRRAGKIPFRIVFAEFARRGHHEAFLRDELLVGVFAVVLLLLDFAAEAREEGDAREGFLRVPSEPLFSRLFLSASIRSTTFSPEGRGSSSSVLTRFTFLFLSLASRRLRMASL